jgi:dTDP-4-dehydrorhamnose 3,5-epimerase
LKPRIFEDDRGYFFESYNKNNELVNQLNYNWVQDNESLSEKGVLRGLHYQVGEHCQAKLVRVIKGEVLDVVVDLRENSETFGQSFSIILSGQNKKQLLVPRGFAHGFLVLSDTAIFSYKCDNFYNKESESGIVYNDSTLDIDWKLKESEFIISEKDLVLPNFNDKLI